VMGRTESWRELTKARGLQSSGFFARAGWRFTPRIRSQNAGD
jgi:hypothetical protein